MTTKRDPSAMRPLNAQHLAAVILVSGLACAPGSSDDETHASSTDPDASSMEDTSLSGNASTTADDTHAVDPDGAGTSSATSTTGLSAEDSGLPTAGSDTAGSTTASATAGSATSTTTADGTATMTGDASTTTDSSATTEDAPGEGWTLVWSDEFDGDTIDPAHWQHEVNCWGGGNAEQQCYTALPTNAFVTEGALHIVARAESTQGPAVNDDDPAYDPDDTSATLPYSSARLRTRDLGDWKYGRIEVRARLPFGQGTWPAIWMLPTDQVHGGWAASGEIDIMEAVNLRVDGERRIYGTLHYGGAWPDNLHSGAETTLPGDADPAEGAHDYAIEWEEGEIRWYVDGEHYATQQQTGWYSQSGDGSIAPGAAPFDERFHLILNVAVGGAWAANVNAGGIDPTVFPQEMVVEYVRVYQCSLNPETGDGCDTVGPNAMLVSGYERPE